MMKTLLAVVAAGFCGCGVLGDALDPPSGSSSSMGYLASEYWTTFINFSYEGPGEEPFTSERTESGRYSYGNNDEVTGRAVELVSANDSRTGCEPPFEVNFPLDEQWIAVVSRGSCTFNEKIKNALSLNASGVLVYDNVSVGVIQSMVVDKFPIPSVFTYEWKGKEIVGMIGTKEKVTLTLSRASRCRTARKLPPDSSKVVKVLYCIPPDEWDEIQHLLMKNQGPFWNWNVTGLKGGGGIYSVEKRTSVVFVSVSFLILVLISLAWLVFYYVERLRYYQEKDLIEKELSTQAKRALAIISTSVLKSEDLDNKDQIDTCAVCIETFRVDDVVRILPCKHQFHKECVDQWLLEKRTCPMCKMDILRYYGLIEEESSAENEPQQANVGGQMV